MLPRGRDASSGRRHLSAAIGADKAEGLRSDNMSQLTRAAEAHGVSRFGDQFTMGQFVAEFRDRALSTAVTRSFAKLDDSRTTCSVYQRASEIPSMPIGQC